MRRRRGSDCFAQLASWPNDLELTVTDYELNPDLPDDLFEFTPPPGGFIGVGAGRKALSLSGAPTDAGPVTLEVSAGAGKVEVYAAGTGGDPLSGEGLEWDTISEMPDTLYVEAVEGSDAYRDVELKLSCDPVYACDTVRLTAFEVDLQVLGFDDSEEEYPGVFLPRATTSPDDKSYVYTVFNDPVEDLTEGEVSLSLSEGMHIWQDYACTNPLVKLAYDLSVPADRQAFLADVCNDHVVVTSDTASDTVRDRAFTCSLFSKGAQAADRINYTVINASLPSDTVCLAVGDTTIVTGSCSPPPDEPGCSLVWTFVGDAGAFLSPLTPDSDDVRKVTATGPGIGGIRFTYYAPNSVFSTDTRPLEVYSVDLDDTVVAVLGEPIEISAHGEPAGDTYTWSIAGTGGAAATIEPNPTTSDTVQLTPTSPGTGEVGVAYAVAADTADLTILHVAITSPSFVRLLVGDTGPLSAAAIPDPAAIGGTLAWSLDGGGGTFAPGNEENTVLEATSSGSGHVLVEYSFGGKAATDSIPATILRTDSLTWQPFPGNDPLTQGRIYPGRQTPNDPLADTRPLTILEAQISPAIAGETVRFAVFDVDNPDTTEAPVDTTDGSRPSGRDNFGTPQAGTLLCEVGVTNEAGVATVPFRVTTQPGDNFRAAASLDSSAIIALTQQDADAGTTQAVVEHVAWSDVLTVWRRLHVELDCMGTPVGNQVSGSVTATAAAAGGRWDVTIDQALADIDQYENGTLTRGTPYVVVPEAFGNPGTANTAGGAPQRVTVTAGSDPGVGAFTLVDDDSRNPAIPDHALLAAAFADAYVLPVVEGAAQDTDATFDLHVDSQAEAGTRARERKDLTSAADYWVATVLGAFQYSTDQDNDPESEGVYVGLADSLTGHDTVACLFVEAIRDLSAEPSVLESAQFIERQTLLHEIGHMFNGQHGDGGAMAGGSPNPYTLFTSITIERIMRIDYP